MPKISRRKSKNADTDMFFSFSVRDKYPFQLYNSNQIDTDTGKERPMTDETIRRRRIWKLVYPAARAFCRLRYHLTLDPITAERPYLLIANHTTNFLDILLVAFAAGKDPL